MSVLESLNQTQHLHKTESKDTAQSQLLGFGDLQIPDEKDGKEANDEILDGADSSNRYDDSPFIAASQFVLKPPSNVEHVKESVGRGASEGDQQYEEDTVDGAEDDGSPDPIHKVDC